MEPVGESQGGSSMDPQNGRDSYTWRLHAWLVPALAFSVTLRWTGRAARWFLLFFGGVLFAIVASPLHAKGVADSTAPLGVASNSWLECALVDLASTSVKVERLAPPGACPGHYDIRPDEAVRLRSARAVVLFDFQQSLAGRLREFLPASTQLVLIHPADGLCVPETYADACRQLRDALVRANLLESDAADRALSATVQRMERLASRLRDDARPVRGVRVVASAHQAAFCRWLGLDVIAVWQSADASSAKEVAELLDEARRKRVQCVIANLQEAGKVGRSLADALGVPLVVFSNFPAMTPEEPDFDSLVRHNVSNLIKLSGGGQ
ncbi:MAG: hypothetical protein KatS3mg130_1351 [Candidatus Sumerlaea sp.]|nr:MAG: hypothetical protein KatS3mg130_1351 [Candidatus Sumerlaea sp.]